MCSKGSIFVGEMSNNVNCVYLTCFGNRLVNVYKRPSLLTMSLLVYKSLSFLVINDGIN